jgi:molybdopterin-guanine dinucleotide biosynthesis protein A
VTDVTGVLLAGGVSRRFPPNKLLIKYQGEPLFWRPLRALASACGEIVLEIGAGAPDPPLPLLDTTLRIARDRAADQGPLVALDSALAGVTTTWALLVAGDMPDLVPALLRALVERAAQSDADAVALSDGENTWPMPGVFRAAAARAATSRLVEDGERRLRAIVTALRAEPLGEEWWRAYDPGGSWRRDIDRPADLRSS